ncbi:uncharacterized protein B0I36DRAFT_400498, partial [Microdochium trichocladiopsis]
ERELAPEVEEQRQLERPDKAEPRKHTINADVVTFIQTGSISAASKAFIPVYESLADSSAGEDLLQLRRHRPRTLKHMVIISPYKVQGLMDTVKQSRVVTLHRYAPLLNKGLRSLDRLDLYTGPSLAPESLLRDMPVEVMLELDLFAGQLYFKIFAEFEALREYLLAPMPLALSPPVSPAGDEACGGSGSDGAAHVMDENLVGLLNIVMMTMRRNSETIDKTHTGKALDSRLIAKDEFKE